jgi:hypothetical protein
MLVLALLSPALAAPYFGIDYVPFGRQDLAWVDSGQESGALVGEFDGMVDPSLTAQAGPLWDQSALLFGLGVAWTSTTVHAGNDVSSTHAGTIRPSVDYRYYLRNRVAGHADGFAQLGGYGLIPTAATKSDAFSNDEQKDADQEAAELRSRLGGFGVRAGIGADISWDSGLTLGARYLVVAHRGADKVSDSTTSSVLVFGEAGIFLGFVL